MRIVYVLTSLGIGGAERQVLALAERMAARGHAVALLALMPQVKQEWPTSLNVFYLNLRKTPFSALSAAMRATRFLREFRPGIVHSHSFHGNILARMMRLIGASVAPVSTVHNVYEGRWWRMLAYRVTDPLSALTTAVSSAAAERFVQLKAVRASKCRVITNGIDIREFASDAARRNCIRQNMSACADFIWLTAGRIVAAKDYPNLLRAFALVTQKHADAQLWIAGEGPDKAAMHSLCAELGLAGSVQWLGLRRDLPALMDAADGFVLGSAWEGMPLVVGEAMAMEKPVVATDVGGTRELVGDAELIVDARDPEGLASAMLRLMSMPEAARSTLGRAARARITAHFSIDAKADEWELLYEDIARRRT